jgi:hypothetical protein
MRLSLFVLRHFNLFPHQCFVWSEDIPNSEENKSAAQNCCDGKNLSGIQFYP